MTKRNSAHELHSARRAFEARVGHALSLVNSRAALGDAAVHEIRKDVKQARAALRVLRDAVPEAVYRQENARLRDSARPLARVRDVRAMLDTIDALLANRKMRPHRRPLLRLRDALRREHAELRRHLRGNPLAREIGGSLEESADRVHRWRMPAEGWPLARSGIRRIYRRGRRALEAARKLSSDRALHESRKQVKYLHAAMQAVAEARPHRLKKAAQRADEVAERLGDDHDLAVLSAEIRRQGADRPLLEALRRKRGKLQKKAIRRARRLYARKPRRFMARME